MREKEILLIEDNENDIILTRRALSKAKILNRIVVARDGVEAIKYLLGEQATPSSGNIFCPALILLDINLPKINGLEVLRRLRSDERTCMCPVVILTSSREEADIIAGYKLGANSFIRKPVDFDQFVEAVRHLGLYWLVLNETPPNNSTC
jgi:two-component system, response regulator